MLPKLCKRVSHNSRGAVVEYALSGLAKPLVVADRGARLVDSLPDDPEGSLPTIEEIEAEIGRADGEEG